MIFTDKPVQSSRSAKGSSQKFAHRGQTKELSYGTLPPPSLLKRKCDRQWEKCMADGYAHYPCSSQQPAQTMSSVSRRYASLEVQRPLRNEQGDNLEQSKKNTISTFLSFLHAQKWVASVDECRTEVDSCHALPIWRLQPGLQKPIDDISDGSAPPSFFFAWTCLRSRNDFQHFIGDMLLSASAAVRLVDGRALFFLFLFLFFYCRSHNESGPNPLPPIWKFFRLSAMCELLRWPLRPGQRNVQIKWEIPEKEMEWTRTKKQGRAFWVTLRELKTSAGGGMLTPFQSFCSVMGVCQRKGCEMPPLNKGCSTYSSSITILHAPESTT